MKETTITLQGHRAFMEGAICNLVFPLLEHPVRRFRTGGPHGYHHKLEVVKHYHLEDNGQLSFSAGLVPYIRRHLERLGYAIRVAGQTNGVLITDADCQMLEDPDLTAEDVRFLGNLLNEPKGQVLVQKPSDIGRHIALFARFFHVFNFYVVARNKKRVKQLVDQISRHTDRSVTSDSRDVWKHNPRIFVGTIQLFQHSMSEGFQIAIFTDAESVLAARTENTPDVWQDGTWYALLEAGPRLTDYELFRLEEMCGPVIFDPSEDNALVNVNVMFIDVHRNNSTPADRGLARKRALYWDSQTWNRIIAKTAMALALNGIVSPALQQAGLKLRKPSVSILVESSEHGKELLKQLPQWELLTDNTPTSCCIPMMANQQIATFAYAERWGLGTDVLIRADGGSGWPLSLVSPHQAQREDDTLLLIDFEDYVDRAAVRDTKSRHASYEQLGWDNVTMDNGQIEGSTEGGDG